MTQSAILYADSNRGIYIPQYFAQSVNPDHLKYVTPADLDILKAGPDNADYWETWDSVLSDAELIDTATGKTGVLYQDGDLWVIFAESAINACNAHVESVLKYETTHRDAGDSYAHMPAESWTRQSELDMAKQFDAVETWGTLPEPVYRNGWREIQGWIEKYPAIDCKGLGLDEVADLALDNFVMMAGNIYTASCPDSVVVLDSYPVGEIELQDLADSVGLDGVTFEHIRDSLDCHVTASGYGYISTDCVWYAVIDRVELQALIDAKVESAE